MKVNQKPNESISRKYIIDYNNGSGSGCDTIFTSREDAERHMKVFYTAKEREGLVIIELQG